MFFFIAEDNTTLSFVETLSLRHGKTHVVEHTNNFADVIKFYSTQLHSIMQEFPFRTAFAGEQAADLVELHMMYFQLF